MLEFNLVLMRACGDQNAGSGNRDTGGTRAPCEIKGGVPDSIVDGELGQESLELPKHLLVTISTRAIP